MSSIVRKLLVLGCALGFLGSAVAMGAGGAFQVTIEVARAADRCTSAALSTATHAEVQVVCATGQFVGIEPAPGKPFLGTHGAAFRYVLDLGGFVPTEWLLGADQNGTVTSLRVYNVHAQGGPLEMLVSF